MSSTEAVLLMCFAIGFRTKTASPYCWHVQQSCLFLLFCHFSKKNHLARCLVSGVADGRDNSRKLRPAMLALSGSSRPGVPDAALGHGRSWQPTGVEPEVPVSSAEAAYWCSVSGMILALLSGVEIQTLQVLDVRLLPFWFKY